MRIYLAGSFKNIAIIRKLGEKIRFYGHHVYVFCDEEEDTYHYSMRVRKDPTIAQWTAAAALTIPHVRLIGLLNWTALGNVDAVIVVLPCGKSAHLEAGFAKGQGKKMYVYGPMPEGEWDAMYIMADGMYEDHEFDRMMADINA